MDKQAKSNLQIWVHLTLTHRKEMEKRGTHNKTS